MEAEDGSMFLCVPLALIPEGGVSTVEVLEEQPGPLILQLHTYRNTRSPSDIPDTCS